MSRLKVVLIFPYCLYSDATSLIPDIGNLYFLCFSISVIRYADLKEGALILFIPVFHWLSS